MEVLLVTERNRSIRPIKYYVHGMKTYKLVADETMFRSLYILQRPRLTIDDQARKQT